MKTYIRFFMILLMFMPVFLLDAQNKGKEPNKQHSEKKALLIEQFNSKKRAYLIQEVGMTKSEADQFFPLYDKMTQQKFEINRKVRHSARALSQSKDAVSDQAYLQMVEEFNTLPVKEAEIENMYIEQFKKILSPQKLLKYKISEMRFGRDILKGHINK